MFKKGNSRAKIKRRKIKSSYIIYIIILLLVISGTVLFDKFVPLPYVWILDLWALLFLVLALNSSKKYPKVLFINIEFFLITISLFELLLSIVEIKNKKNEDIIRCERVYDGESDDITGFRMLKNSSRQARKYINDSLIYDIVITSDSNRLRISPPCKGPCNEAILFFGNSFTFGEGVNDNETMPYNVGLMADSGFAVYNFGVSGFGPHQMLAAIEHGVVSSIVKENVKYTIFQLLYPEHLYRLSGKRKWDTHGPRYVLNEKNQAVNSGHFDDYRKKEILTKSAILNKIRNKDFPNSDKTKQLLIAIIVQSKDIIEQSNPEMEFHIIAWDWTEGCDDWVFEEMKKHGIKIHKVKDILPDGDKSNLAYKIHQKELHPNSYTQKILADFVVQHILKSKE